MNTKPVKAPKEPSPQQICSTTQLFAKHVNPDSGEARLRPLSLADYSCLINDEDLRNGMNGNIQFLTWNGENFAWREVTRIRFLAPTHQQVVNLQVSARTGVTRSTVLQNAQLSCLNEVYGLTKDAPDGIWRTAKMTASGRTLVSVSGPDLLPKEGGIGVPWVKGSFHRATVNVIKAKTGYANFVPACLKLGDATNVVLASGILHRLYEL